MILEPDKIDFIHVDSEKEEICLILTDHLDWSVNVDEHFQLLIDKINHYMAYALDGQMLEMYPNSDGYKVVIQLIFMNLPPLSTSSFFGDLRDVLDGHQFSLSLNVREGDEIIEISDL